MATTPNTLDIVTLDIETVRRVVQGLLVDYFAANHVLASKQHARYGALWQALEGLVLAPQGGKRLRPYMTVLAYQGYGGRDEAIYEVAAAYELLHACLLIHDDIIDRDDVRYGIKNVTGQYIERYGDTVDGRHFAEGAALLGGDLLLAGAFAFVAASSFSAEDRLAAQADLQAAIFAVAGGELIDMEAVSEPFIDIDTIGIAQYKTAIYSCVAPLQTGARLAGANDKELGLLHDFGVAFGIAYQLMDDVLGIFGDSTKTGKSNTGDIAEGKRTYLMQTAFRMAPPAEQAILTKLVGKADISRTEVNQVRTILDTSGARSATAATMMEYKVAAETALHATALDKIVCTELQGLLEKTLHGSRQK